MATHHFLPSMWPLDLGQCVAKWANEGDALTLENFLIGNIGTTPKMTTHLFV